MAGNDKVDTVEEGGIRTIKSTGVYSGIKLEIHLLQSFYDERLESNNEDSFVCFNVKSKEIKTDEQWKQACKYTLYNLNSIS